MAARNVTIALTKRNGPILSHQKIKPVSGRVSMEPVFSLGPMERNRVQLDGQQLPKRPLWSKFRNLTCQILQTVFPFTLVPTISLLYHYQHGDGKNPGFRAFNTHKMKYSFILNLINIILKYEAIVRSSKDKFKVRNSNLVFLSDTAVSLVAAMISFFCYFDFIWVMSLNIFI